MNIALWIVQGLLAVAFIMAGFMKGMMPVEELAKNMAWVKDSPVWVVRLSGFSEIAGALGLILPSVTRIAPILTPIAALALGLVMLLAAGMHGYRGELGGIAPPVVLLCLCLFVAYGRLKAAPIQPK